MPYETALYDSFWVSAMPRPGDRFVFEGSDASAGLTFSGIVEPVTLKSQYFGGGIAGDILTVEGVDWTIGAVRTIEVNKYSGTVGTYDTYANSSFIGVTLTSGSTTRYMIFQPESNSYPITDATGAVQDMTYFEAWYSDSMSALYTNELRRDDENHVHAVCFAAGTMIDTARGPRPVQSLGIGDLVRTRDNGFQPLRWLGGRRLSGADLARAPQLAPIRIAAGALGPAQPAQDLTVSPQHRLLVRSPIAERIAGHAEMLAAAVHLLDLPGVARLSATGGVAYWHMMFDRHEIVFANGAEAESLYLGPMARQALSPDALAEIAALFPELTAGDAAAPAPARPFLRGGQARKLVERQVKNNKPLVAPLALLPA